MSKEMKKLIRQNEVIISLLGRIAFTPEQVRKLVRHKKRRHLKDRYVDGYNALDGKKRVADIAQTVGVDKGTVSRTLNEWEEWGIIYEIERPGGKFYKKLFPI